MKLFLSALILFFGTLRLSFAGGAGSSPELKWDNILQVKGGFNACWLTADGFGGDGVQQALAVYNPNGRILSISNNWGFNTLFTYDSGGKLAEVQVMNTEGGPLYKRYVYSYDGSGKLVKYETYNDEGKLESTRKAYDYEKNGNFKLETVDSDGKVNGYDLMSKDLVLLESDKFDFLDEGGLDRAKFSAKTEYAYDKYGSLTQRTEKSAMFPHGALDKSVTWKFDYEYDKSGNKTRMTVSVTPESEFKPEDVFKKISYAYTNIKFKSNANNDEKNRTITGQHDTVSSTITSVSSTSVSSKSGGNSGDVNKKVKVEWKGNWYPATILKVEGEKYYIHYDEYDSNWDEWVTKDRIKF